MQKQSIFFAASIALVFAMSSVSDAQSDVTQNQTYADVVLGEPDMVRPASTMPNTSLVDPNPICEGAPAPAPSIPSDDLQNTTPFVLPPTPVWITSPVQHISPQAHALPREQHMTMPTTVIMQPVCSSGG